MGSTDLNKFEEISELGVSKYPSFVTAILKTDQISCRLPGRHVGHIMCLWIAQRILFPIRLVKQDQLNNG